MRRRVEGPALLCDFSGGVLHHHGKVLMLSQHSQLTFNDTHQKKQKGKKQTELKTFK